MPRKGKTVPFFNSPEEEAEYWETHSSMELGEAPLQPLPVEKPSERPLSIRLTSERRRALEDLAGQQKVGPSTLARMIVEAVLEDPMQLQLVLMGPERLREAYENLPPRLKESLEALRRDVAVPDGATEPEFLIIPVRRFQEVFAAVAEAMVANLGIRLPATGRGRQPSERPPAAFK